MLALVVSPTLMLAGMTAGCSEATAQGAWDSAADDGGTDDGDRGAPPADSNGGEPSQEPEPDGLILGTDDDDVLQGTPGDDVMHGLGGVDELRGGEGDDILYGGDQLDMLHGEGGDDLLFGGAGPDVLDGGKGDDRLEGGYGSDTYVHARGEGRDVIVDVEGSHDRLMLIGYEPHEVDTRRDDRDMIVKLPDGEIRLQGQYAGFVVEELVFERHTPDVHASLGVGIVWYGSDGAAVRHVPGHANPFLDPGRPTLLLTHGWSPGAIDRVGRHGLPLAEPGGPELDVLQPWIEAGWNVGIFHWEQLADEALRLDAEAKVWTAHGPAGMRWRSTQQGVVETDMGGRSVTDLFVRAYAEALAELRSEEIRLAGHDVGAQLVLTAAAALWAEQEGGDLSPRLMPRRVALLDPTWGSGVPSWLGVTTGQHSREHLATLAAEEVAVETYRSSPPYGSPLVDDANAALVQETCWVDLHPGYHEPDDFAAMHAVAVWHYLWAQGAAAPVDPLGAVVCSSATGDDEISEGMLVSHHWQQDEGTGTHTPLDDTFVRVD